MRRKAFLFSLLFSISLSISSVCTVEASSTMWMQTYDSGTNSDNGHCVVETSDGGYAIAGYSYPSGGKSEAWLVKTDANGNEQWIQNYGGTEWDEAYSVIQTSDEGYAIVGYTKSFGEESSSFWLVKTDANGVEQWNKVYDTPKPDTAYSVVETSDGGYAIVGDSGDSWDDDCDVWLVKTAEQTLILGVVWLRLVMEGMQL